MTAQTSLSSDSNEDLRCDESLSEEDHNLKRKRKFPKDLKLPSFEASLSSSTAASEIASTKGKKNKGQTLGDHKKKKSSNSIGKEYMIRGKRYACQFCRKSFKKAQALGGHISKAHPSMSQGFVEKLRRRQEREPQRELLRRAKEIYYAKFG